MPITHFKITELPFPNIIETLFDGNPIVLNTPYPIAQQNLLSFQRYSTFNNLWIEAPFKWKAINNDGIESPETVSVVRWLPFISGEANSANVTSTILNTDVVSLIETLPLDSNVEFIEILNITGANKLNIPISIGQRFTIPELSEITFTPDLEVGGEPYFVLNYDVGNSNTLEGKNYHLTLNIDSLANLIEYTDELERNYSDTFDVLGVPTVYNVKEQTFNIEINNGTYKGIAEVEFDIISDFLALNEWNKVVLEIEGEETEYFENTNFTQNIQLDHLGKARITIKNVIVEDTMVDKDGEINLALHTIDTESGKVSGTNTLTLITDY